MPRYLPTVGRFDFAWTDDEKHPVNVLEEEWDDAAALFGNSLSLPPLHLAEKIITHRVITFSRVLKASSAMLMKPLAIHELLFLK